MNYIIFEPTNIERFYPFSLTRPLGEMRVFGGTIKEIWEKILNQKVSYLTRSYLSHLYPTKWESDNILIPTLYFTEFIDFINEPDLIKKKLKKISIKSTECNLEEIQKKWSSVAKDSNLIFNDLTDLIYKLKNNNYFLSKKSTIDCSKSPLLNDDDGPIIIEDDVTIMEGAMIRGPVQICKGSVIKMGAKIYGPTVIGPYCKIGGEVSRCIFLGYSNKAHEGFLGDSIIGEWCNIGAGTSNSNLKNNYDNVKMWDYSKNCFKDTGKQFLGMYMGDHTKCSINSSINTGSTIGVSCNIFGSGFPRNYISSFSWGGAAGFKQYNIENAIKTAKIVMKRRDIEMSQEYELMFRKVFDMTQIYRI